MFRVNTGSAAQTIVQWVRKEQSCYVKTRLSVALRSEERFTLQACMSKTLHLKNLKNEASSISNHLSPMYCYDLTRLYFIRVCCCALMLDFLLNWAWAHVSRKEEKRQQWMLRNDFFFFLIFILYLWWMLLSLSLEMVFVFHGLLLERCFLGVHS